MDPDIETIVAQTLSGQLQPQGNARPSDSTAALSSFQWPWDIAKAGAKFLKEHGSAVDALVSGGRQAVSAPGGAAIVANIEKAPTDPASTGALLNNGIFSNALNGVKADQLLRTVFIGFSGGAQVGLVGGDGGSGVAYDIVDQANCSAVHYSAFTLGIGGKVSAGLILGAMAVEPTSLKASLNTWSFGAAVVGISVFVQVLMDSDHLNLIGFGLNLGGGAGLASTVGYGSISTG